MSTYAAETAVNLKASLESLYAQTVPPDQIVLVVDGPVDRGQEDVIAQYRNDRRILHMSLIRLPKSRGLANAMNVGLENCYGEFALRMDSDDVCEPDRIEVQLAYARAHPEISLIGTWSEEFYDDGAPSHLKVSPASHDAIVRALRWRNVLVHSSILVRAEALRRVGGYRETYGKLEDYDLFIRLAQAGVKFHIIPKVLVRVRSGTEQRIRRGGLAYCIKEIRFRIDCFRSGFLNVRQLVMVTAMYTTFRLVSGQLRRRLYSLVRT
ncbi:glycosyltransferase [Microvirga sp. c23x22]|uniref:Glycosyltransferase n=2 Tax=Microvirga terricola TaxID=2719797 RepID=A0ABX0V8M5_9HYPH|nr:glycosyltransferase [Microvirga terricola]